MPNPEVDKGKAPNIDVAVQEASPRRVERASLAKTIVKATGLSPLAQSSSEPATTVILTRRPTPAPPSAPTTASPLYHVQEDQVGASKEALIQVGLMSSPLKDAYNASEVLQTNI